MTGVSVSGSSRLETNHQLTSQKYNSVHRGYRALSDVARYLWFDCKFYLPELNNGELVSSSSYTADGPCD
jgi:hypothetical protein